MLTEETNKEPQTTPANPEAEIANEESAPEERGKGTWREAFLSAFQTARRQQMALKLPMLRYAFCVTEVDSENPFDRRDEQENE